MKKSILILGIMLTMLIPYQALALEIESCDENLPRFIIVEGLGKIALTHNMTNLEQDIRQREQDGESNLDLPSKVKVLIPATKTCAAKLKKVKIKDQNETVIKMETNPVDPTRAILRTFLGPKIRSENGKVISNANIWFDGYTSNHETTSGLINPAVLLPKNQRDLTMIVYAPGYEMKVIDLKIPKESMKDDKSKFPLLEDDIILSPAKNLVLQTKITNYKSRIYSKKVKYGVEYRQVSKDKYHFLYTVFDHYQNKTFRTVIPLEAGMNNISSEYEIQEHTKKLEGKKVAVTDLPATIPRIKIYSQLRLRTVEDDKANQAAKVEFDDGKTKMSPTFGAFLFLCIAAIAGTLIYKVIKEHNKFKAAMKKHSDEQERQYWIVLLAAADFPEHHVTIVNKINNLLASPNLNPASKTLLTQMTEKLEKLLLNIQEKRMTETRLKEELKKMEFNKETAVSSMKEYLEKSWYDQAAMMKQRIFDCEVSISKITEFLDANMNVYKERSQQAQELFKILRETAERSDHFILQAQQSAEFVALSNKVSEILQESQTGYDTESSFDLSSAQIKAEKQERRKAQNTGIDANDIDDLKTFLEERS